MPEPSHWLRFGVFIVYFEQSRYLNLVAFYGQFFPCLEIALVKLRLELKFTIDYQRLQFSYSG